MRKGRDWRGKGLYTERCKGQGNSQHLPDFVTRASLEYPLSILSTKSTLEEKKETNTRECGVDSLTNKTLVTVGGN